jgi:integration host factor subunit beta
MLKSEPILRIADLNPRLYEKDVEAIVNAILDRITDALVAGDQVELRRFGAFMVKTREAHMDRNPKSGAAVLVEDKRVPTFKTGKTMQARLNASETPTSSEMEAAARLLLRA